MADQKYLQKHRNRGEWGEGEESNEVVERTSEMDWTKINPKRCQGTRSKLRFSIRTHQDGEDKYEKYSIDSEGVKKNDMWNLYMHHHEINPYLRRGVEVIFLFLFL